ncbi:uncharacterized protein LOC135397836 [Ornithodoros turicata]|uniref:uncharacterized protein LOC135397836 n=1 Tax=Ornithodoros turicata TaxID=34597 RepID=UPI00313A3BA4
MASCSDTYPSRMRTTAHPRSESWCHESCDTDFPESVRKTTRHLLPVRVSRTADHRQRNLLYNQHHRDWDLRLAELAFATRMTVNRSTGFTSAFLNLGREAPFPVENALGLRDGATRPPYSRFAEDLRSRLDDAARTARENLDVARLDQARQYNRGRRNLNYSVGDFVLRRTHPLSDASRAFAASLADRWDGPFKMQRRSVPGTRRQTARTREPFIPPHRPASHSRPAQNTLRVTGSASVRQHSVATWTVVSHDMPVSWASRSRWTAQPRPLHGDDLSRTSAPFRGLILSERHPADPLQPLTAEERRLLCPVCEVPEVHRTTHRRGPLHQARTEAARTATDVNSALATLRRLRPELLTETHPPQAPVVPQAPRPPPNAEDILLDLPEDYCLYNLLRGGGSVGYLIRRYGARSAPATARGRGRRTSYKSGGLVKTGVIFAWLCLDG